MNYKIVVGLFTLVILSSFNQQNLGGELKVESINNAQNDSVNLSINNGQYRGTVYTDSVGTIYNLRYMPVTLTNNSTKPIRLQMNFANEYNFPIANIREKFNVFPMPNEWAIEGSEITDSMIDELPKYINTPVLDKTLQPGEKFLFAIGVKYIRGKTGGVLPNSIFTMEDKAEFKECDRLKNEDFSSLLIKGLGFKFSVSGSCFIIPCGNYSYIESNNGK